MKRILSQLQTLCVHLEMDVEQEQKQLRRYY